MTTTSLPDELVRLTAAFSDLQDHRQSADYDLDAPISLLDARHDCALARRSFDEWDANKNHLNTAVLLTALLFADRWAMRA